VSIIGCNGPLPNATPAVEFIGTVKLNASTRKIGPPTSCRGSPSCGHCPPLDERQFAIADPVQMGDPALESSRNLGNIGLT
jgi:hypothetical protein